MRVFLVLSVYISMAWHVVTLHHLVLGKPRCDFDTAQKHLIENKDSIRKMSNEKSYKKKINVVCCI